MTASTTLRRAIFGLSAARVIAAGAGFTLNLALARLLGAEGFGAYAFVIGCVVIAATAGKWGWDKAAVRFVATYAARADVASLTEFLAVSRRTVLKLSVLCGLACAAWLFFTPVPLAPGAIIAAAAIVPVAGLGLLLQGQLRGASHVVGAELPEGVLKPCAALVFSYVALTCIDGDAVLLAITSGLAAAMLANAVANRLLVHALPAERNHELDSTEARRWHGEIHAYGWLGLVQVGLTRGPAVVAGWVLDPAGIGLIAVAMRLAEPVAFAVSSVGIASAPRIAELYHQGEIAECRRWLASATTYSRRVGLLMCVAVAVAGPWLLKLFGAQFVVAYPVLISICIAQFVAACCGPAGYVVTMSGQQRAAARLQLFALGAGVLATLICGQWFGFIGAGIATAATVVVSNVWVARLATRILDEAGAAAT